VATTPKSAATELRLRLVRAGDAPATNPLADEYLCGLQDTKQQIHPGAPQPDGMLTWDFTVTVKPDPADGHPVFTGPFASGAKQDRFVYLSWRSLARGHYINRVKARLEPIDWPLIHAARAAGRPLVADLTGRPPGAGRTPVVWRLADV
jgi:hypothetical protein